MNLQQPSISNLHTVVDTISPHTIRYSEPLSLIEINWHTKVSSDELQLALTELLQEIKEKEPRYLLADTRFLNSLGTDDQAWIRNSFLPSLSVSSVSKFARITEPDVFTQAVLESILDYVQCEKFFGCSMCSFSSRELALEWMYSF